MAFLERAAVEAIGFASLGNNVLISDCAKIYGAERIKIGNNVRIDDFCVISAGNGGIEIGNFIHIAVYSSIIGNGKILISDFAGLSSRVSIYSSSDDYSGLSMTNPMIPKEFKNLNNADVVVGKHVIIGSGSVILPGVVIGDGSAVGALSLVTKRCDEFCIYAGYPAKKIKERSRDLLQLEEQFLKSIFI